MQAVAAAVQIVGRASQKVKQAIDGSKLSDAVAEVERLNETRTELLEATAAQMIPGLIGGFTAVVIPRDDEFRKQYPQWKRALLNLCRARIAQGEKRLGVILDEARRRYESYGCGEDVEDDLIVRRARDRVGGLRDRLKR